MYYSQERSQTLMVMSIPEKTPRVKTGTILILAITTARDTGKHSLCFDILSFINLYQNVFRGKSACKAKCTRRYNPHAEQKLHILYNEHCHTCTLADQKEHCEIIDVHSEMREQAEKLAISDTHLGCTNIAVKIYKETEAKYLGN